MVKIDIIVSDGQTVNSNNRDRIINVEIPTSARSSTAFIQQMPSKFCLELISKHQHLKNKM